MLPENILSIEKLQHINFPPQHSPHSSVRYMNSELWLLINVENDLGKASPFTME